MTKAQIWFTINEMIIGAAIGSVCTNLIITRKLQFKEHYEIITQIPPLDASIAIPVSVTIYHPVAEQTDSSPLITADGSNIEPWNPQRWCAISQDLLQIFSYGDSVMLSIPQAPYLNGLWAVHDTGPKEITNHVDLLISNPIVCSVKGSWKGNILVTAKKHKELKK